MATVQGVRQPPPLPSQSYPHPHPLSLTSTQLKVALYAPSLQPTASFAFPGAWSAHTPALPTWPCPRGVAGSGMSEIFFRKLKSYNGEPPPIFVSANPPSSVLACDRSSPAPVPARLHGYVAYVPRRTGAREALGHPFPFQPSQQRKLTCTSSTSKYSAVGQQSSVFSRRAGRPRRLIATSPRGARRASHRTADVQWSLTRFNDPLWWCLWGLVWVPILHIAIVFDLDTGHQTDPAHLVHLAVPVSFARVPSCRASRTCTSSTSGGARYTLSAPLSSTSLRQWC